MRATQLSMPLAMALALAGCGRPSGGSDNMSVAASGTVAATSGWKATDACALLDKEVVAATLGSPVSNAELGAVKAEGNGFPLYSQCAFTLADGRMLVFGAGRYTNGASLSEQLSDMRRQAAIVSKAAPVDLPGLGKAALWLADMNQLYAFFGDGRYVSATLMQTDFRKKPDADAKVKADETAILHKAGA